MTRLSWCLLFVALVARPAAAQVDQARAQQYFAEAGALCERDGGRLWGVSLCGPMVIADAATKTIATSQPAPADDRPRFLGLVNAPVQWGGVTWSAYNWQMIPADKGERGRLFMHELFHRVQPGLGLMTGGTVDTPAHLDSLEGRYWIRLEWRALARGLETSGEARRSAIADALAFRAARYQRFPTAAAAEHPIEINEGLATNAAAAAARYDGASLRAAEEQRDRDQQAIVAELRRRFVDGPVLVVPRAGSGSVNNMGATVIPGAGTVFREMSNKSAWGSFDARNGALVSADGETISLPAPVVVDATTLRGDGWTATVDAGWTVQPGPRPGSFHVVRK